MRRNLFYVWTAGFFNCTAVFSKKIRKTNKIANIVTGIHFCKTPPGWQNITWKGFNTKPYLQVILLQNGSGNYCCEKCTVTMDINAIKITMNFAIITVITISTITMPTTSVTSCQLLTLRFLAFKMNNITTSNNNSILRRPRGGADGCETLFIFHCHAPQKTVIIVLVEIAEKHFAHDKIERAKTKN